MAAIKDNRKSNYYHQTVELHLDCGSETLRRVVQKKLENSNYTLKEYLNIPGVYECINKARQNGHLFTEQVELLFPSNGSDPQLNRFDTSLLTFLLLRTKNFNLSTDEKKNINELRGERNSLSHVPKPELEDKSRFHEASKIIVALAQRVDNSFKNEMKETIRRLEKKEFVSCRSKIEIVKMRNEELLVMLVENPQASLQTDDVSDVTYIKFGLTKWAKQFTRTIDLDTFLVALKDEGVLTQTEKLEIEKEYNKEEQSSRLIMKIVDDTEENLWKFCRCLRAANETMADLVANRNTDGKDIENRLKTLEEERIQKVLKTIIVPDAQGSIPSEKVHLIVEEELGYSVDFSVILRITKETFNIDNETGKCFSLQGMSLNNNASDRPERRLHLENSSGNYAFLLWNI